jgi:hypothetical protein
MTQETKKNPLFVYLLCFLIIFLMFAVFGSLIGFAMNSIGHDVNYSNGGLSIVAGSLLVWIFVVKKIRSSSYNNLSEE